MNHTYGNENARKSADRFFALAISSGNTTGTDFIGLVEKYIEDAGTTTTILEEISMFGSLSDTIVRYAFNNRSHNNNAHDELVRLRRQFVADVKSITHPHTANQN